MNPEPEKGTKTDQANDLVNEFYSLHHQKDAIEEKIGRIRQTLIEFSKANNQQKIEGNDIILQISSYWKISYPEDKTELMRLIRQNGLYEELSMLNYARLNSYITKNKIDTKIIELTKKEESYKFTMKLKTIKNDAN